MSYELKKELIAHVEEEECLWNPSCEDYMRSDKKNEAWNGIVRALIAKGFNVDSKFYTRMIF